MTDQFPDTPSSDQLSNVLRAAAQPATAEELQGMAAFVQAFTAEVTTPTPITRSNTMRAGRITRRAATMVAVTLLAAGTAAAAAGGALPNPFKGNDNAAEHAGTHPTDTDGTEVEGTESIEGTEVEGTDDTGVKGPDASGDAAHGLCEAWTHGGSKNANNPAFSALLDAANANTQSVDEYCADVMAAHDAAQGTDSSETADSDHTSGTASEQGQSHSQADDNPSATAPATTNEHASGRKP